MTVAAFVLSAGLLTPTAPPRTTPAAATFTELVPALPAGVVDALARRGIASPTPIQLAAVPQALAGESLLLHAETGSGKSLAFLLPTLLRLGGSGRKLLVVAPTRELCVQLANEAATLLPSASAVQIVAVGCTPSPEALLDASAIVCTAPEMLDALHGGEILGAACGEALRTLGAVVLDELDTLLPIGRVYGGRAEARKKLLNRKEAEAPAQQLLRAVIEACALPDLQARRNSSAHFGAIRRNSRRNSAQFADARSTLPPDPQVVGASATVARPVRLKLERVLRRDPHGRWYGTATPIVRAAEVEARDLQAAPRAVMIPEGVRHFYLRLGAGVKLRRASPLRAARPVSIKRLTLKQKRARKAEAADDAAVAIGTHSLLLALDAALAELKPASALVFICRSAGLTVRRATRELRALGLPATALHEAIGLEHDAEGEGGGGGGGEGGEGGADGGGGEGGGGRNSSGGGGGEGSSGRGALPGGYGGHGGGEGGEGEGGGVLMHVYSQHLSHSY